MRKCPGQPSWFWYWKENMTELGLDVPSTWGGGSSTILSRIAALAVIAEKYGSKVTIAEVLGAGSKTDLLVV